MAFWQSIQAANDLPIPTADTATDTVPVLATFIVPAGLAAGDIIEMGPLQAGYVPTELIADWAKADSNGTPTIKFDVGILSGNWRDPAGARTIGSDFILADVTAQTGGISRMSKVGSLAIAPVSNDRSWGLKVNTAAATLTTGGKITVILTVRPRIEGI